MTSVAALQDVTNNTIKNVTRFYPETMVVPQETLAKLASAQESNPFYCQWNATNTLKDCETRLQEVYPNLLRAKKWYFMGDSATARMFDEINRLGAWKTLHRSDSSKKNQYYGFRDIVPPPEKRILPNSTLGEGPYPPDHIGTFCVTCKNQLHRYRDTSSSIANNKTLHLEFLAMEHARDRSFQTYNSSTSQETISLYMNRWTDAFLPADTVCVVNTGFHDMRILPFMSGRLYAQHVLDFQTRMMERHCRTFLWTSVTQVLRKDFVFPQSQPRVVEYNTAVQQRMLLEPSGAFYLDLFPKSAVTKHADHVHMDGEMFYQPVARFFMQLMTGTVATGNITPYTEK